MTAPSPDERTYDEEEVALILRTAAELEHVTAAAAIAARGGLTLRQIQDVAAEAGLDTRAVAAAAVRVAGTSEHFLSHRFAHAQVLDGELSQQARDRLADAIRTRLGPVSVRHTSDGLELEVKNPELGAMLVEVRSGRGTTTVSVWSETSKIGTADAAGYSLLGIIPTLFTAVAATGGVWPALGTFAALVAGGAGVGTAVGVGAWRWRTDRWRRRLTELTEFVAMTASALAVTPDGGDPSTSRGIPPIQARPPAEG